MTEESFQQARKIMQKANHLRGTITAAKTYVQENTRMEDYYRRNLKEDTANKYREKVQKSLLRLKEQRDKFAALKFPDSDIIKKYEAAKCKSCGCDVAQGNEYCGECTAESFYYHKNRNSY